MPEAKVNGIDLYYEEHGQGAPILCIHGTSSSALMWGDAVPELAQLGRLITYDRRGCTRSQRPDRYERTSVAEHADDAAALLEALDAPPAVVIGRSYGGSVALDLALGYPDRVRALVLLEGAPPELSPQAAAWEAELGERISELAERAGVDAVAESFIGEVLGEETWRSLPAQLRQMFTENGPAILAELLGEGLQADADELSTIDQPALLVTAADSPPAFREANEALADALPKARTSGVGGGHLISPADAEVVAFLQELLQSH